MSLRILACLVGLAACRIDFDARGDAALPAHDAPRDVSAITCPPDALVCDDFESGDLAKWSGMQIVDGPVAIVTAPVHTGAHALSATVVPTGSSGDEAYVYFTLGAQPFIAARAWFYLPDPLQDSEGVIYFVHAGAEDRYLEVLTDSTWQLTKFDGALTASYTAAVPEQARWTCLELDWDRVAGTATLIADGTAMTSSAFTDTTVDRIGIGATRANAGGLRVFVDDAIVATSPIGCE